ncbi:MAG TPA: CoA-binding protein [Firmicutes bacterium]|nr:CoA-binding protein [Bacillota bacterium]
MDMEISPEICAKVMSSTSVAIWPIDENPLSESFQTARYFQDQGWRVYPVHDWIDRICDELCYRDIRLIPDDYDILALFIHPDKLAEVVNSIFNADYIPPVVWAHTGILDLEQLDRLREAGIMAVMDRNLMETHKEWCRL